MTNTKTPSFTGKTVIVTGSNRGLGRAIATRLAAEGASVMLAARDAVLLKETQAEIVDQGGKAEHLAIDLRDPAAPGALVAETLKQFRHLDLVVSNAGATRRGNFLDLTDDDWSDGFALKFFGAVRLIRAAWPALMKSKGSVVIISGIGGRTPGAQFAIGGSVNAGLLSLTKALAEQGVRDGVQVNAINPGAVKTERLRKRIETSANEWGVSQEEAGARMIRENRLSRFGLPSDIASLVAFIASPEGQWLQGSLIDIDGGETKTI